VRRVAVIVLNRNLPDVTDALCKHIQKFDCDLADVYVVEAGSDPDRLSRNSSWHANWDEARREGLRYARGMNYGLSQLLIEGRFANYDAFFLITNDTELEPKPTIQPLLQILDAHPRLGILSPCSTRWGERFLLGESSTKYFWFIHNNALLFRRQMIEEVANFSNPSWRDFLFDGSNFRGYCLEMEVIAKGYINGWAAAITNTVWSHENESHLLTKADLIKTEVFEENLRLYVEEGRRWMRQKYGFNSRWSMQLYVKLFYDQFFSFYPEFKEYRL
jgi:hypothetical protein